MYKDEKDGIVQFDAEFRLAGMMGCNSLADVETAQVIIELASVVEELYEKVNILTKENEQLKAKMKNNKQVER